jgi:hypothetical protein
MIERELASPDDGDALSLTFAQPVLLPQGSNSQLYVPASSWGVDYE